MLDRGFPQNINLQDFVDSKYVLIQTKSGYTSVIGVAPGGKVLNFKCDPADLLSIYRHARVYKNAREAQADIQYLKGIGVSGSYQIKSMFSVVKKLGGKYE